MRIAFPSHFGCKRTSSKGGLGLWGCEIGVVVSEDLLAGDISLGTFLDLEHPPNCHFQRIYITSPTLVGKHQSFHLVGCRGRNRWQSILRTANIYIIYLFAVSMYSSTLSTSNLYERAIKIDPKYSSTSRHNNRPKNIRVVVKNENLTKALSKVNLKAATPQPAHATARTQRKQNPQVRAVSTSRSLKQFRSTLEKNLQAQLIGVKRLRESSKLHERQLKERRAAETRMRTRQKQELEQQIQFKRKEREREIQVKLRRKTSEKQFILNSHKESVEMLRKSRQVRTRSEVKLLKDRYVETERDHDFLQLKIRATKLRQNFEYVYKKAFVKNQPLPKGVYPNLTPTLAIASKTMTSSPTKTTKKLPKIEKSPTKNAINPKVKNARKKTENSEVHINLDVQTAKKQEKQIVKSEPKAQPEAVEAPTEEKAEQIALESPPVLESEVIGYGEVEKGVEEVEAVI